ncbi:unnamed protein product [Trifolium pratense]|uniref:Uncharacterized protein n=1 Tax=Trifolium pratense TaxID=57577 RepID=A0ACB0KA95_TRIPR|nr:unnamed protein product [Trifolium pratense]
MCGPSKQASQPTYAKAMPLASQPTMPLASLPLVAVATQLIPAIQFDSNRVAFATLDKVPHRSKLIFCLLATSINMCPFLTL